VIPGKHYTPELVLGLAWRHKWLILIPAVVVAAIGCAITYLLPDTYRSEARILIVAQRVPESYIRSTVTTRIEDRLRSIDAQVRSRAKLERIIEDFNLYPERRATEIMQDVIDDMNRNIDVDLVQGDVFSVAFTADNPRVAKDVAERLTTFFIEESLKDRTALAENTSEFLETEVGIAQRKLREVEQKIMEYKRRHDGELPTQADANSAALQNAQMQLQSLDNQIAQNRDNQAMLLRRIADLQARVEDAAKTPLTAIPVEPGRPMTKAAALAAKQAEFQKERAGGKAVGHPTIDRLLREIKQLEAEAAEEAAAATPLGTPAVPAPPANPPLERATRELDDTKSDLSRLERRIDADLESQRVVRQQIAEFQRRILAAPMRDTELVDLTRDYDTLNAHYNSLSSKRIDSQVSANVERRQIGEQFRILDPARLPEKPDSPNRDQLYLISFVLALLVGLTAAAGAEYLDRGLRSEDDVRLALALPVLATIPVIGPGKTAGRRWRFLGASAAVVVLSGAVGAAWLVLR
jgi:polysaccharide chain length determinant protein (PEP-CTERM system associated)